MSSSHSGNDSNKSPVDQSSETILHELNTLERDELIGSEDAQPIQSKKKPIMKDLMAQCASCQKWRLISSKQKYEIIREKQLETPFVCETASEWKPNMSCDVPEDETTCEIWAIDVFSIPRTPTGWERVMQVRREGSKRFADVYYFAPSEKKRLRSIAEVEKFLTDHPEYLREGVNLSQFSFQMPKPRDDNYVTKRTRQVKPTVSNEGDHRASEHGQSSKRTKT